MANGNRGRIVTRPDYTPTVAFAQMHTAPLSSPRPLPVGEGRGAGYGCRSAFKNTPADSSNLQGCQTWGSFWALCGGLFCRPSEMGGPLAQQRGLAKARRGGGQRQLARHTLIPCPRLGKRPRVAGRLQ
jgi:hypothetical protein